MLSICSSQERKTDLIKQCFKPDCDTLETIWESNNLLNPCATIIFAVASVCDPGATVTITINRKIGSSESFSLNEGESRAITIDQIESIQVQCNVVEEPSSQCVINFCMIIHYDRC